MANERRQYIRKQIHKRGKNQYKLWATVNNILLRTAMPSMPDSTDLPFLCASFPTFFVDKIEKNRLKFCTDNRKPKFIPPPEIKCHLTCFEPATSEEVRKLILTSPTKTCALDLLPTSLLKSCVDVLLTPITNIVNLSLKSGVFPDTLKLSHITPLLKKPPLSKDDMTNYRPVSNLNFISKLLEKIIANRIRSHLQSNDLLNRYQSAYRPMHSTETALLKVQNDLLRNLDDGKTTVLLDLSAAFDTLDHSGEEWGSRVVVNTAAVHARVRGSVPCLGGLKETKMFFPHPRVKVIIVGRLRDREVTCSASDRQGSNFESCVWRTVSSHHPQEVLPAQFSLYVYKGGLKPDSFHYHSGDISMLENWYGISGNALLWFASYLMDRQQMVKVKECVGEPFQTKYGVPQGSVLGPLLFTLYTIPLSKIISRHNVCHHLSADDTQIYITLFKSEPEMLLALLQDCLLDVCDWMRSSKLKLNPDKTEVLLFGTKLHRKEFMKHFPAKVLDQEITPTDSARNL